MKKKSQVVYIVCACLCVLSPVASATTASAHSNAIHYSEVGDGQTLWTFADGSQYEYKYEITLSWLIDDSQQGLSHLDLDLENVLECDYALFDAEGFATGNIRFEDLATYQIQTGTDEFGNPIYTAYNYDTGVDGQTFSPNEDDPLINDPAVNWGGYIDADQNTASTIIRYQQPLEYDASQPAAPEPVSEPGKEGTGTFWFYSHFAPIEATGDIVLKYGNNFGMEYLGEDALTGELPHCPAVPEPTTMALLGLGGLLLRRRK